MVYERSLSNLYKVVFISLFILFFTFQSGDKVLATPSEAENTYLILLDPGHGGIDGGAVSRRGLIEKDINLSISQKVKELLKDSGYQVLMTRDKDMGLYTKKGDINMMKREDLGNRCKIKRDSGCDLFISIHQNFFKDGSCKGAQVWYTKNEDSKRFGKILQQNLISDLDRTNNRQEKEAKNDYKILRCYTNIPSVIVECGFLTNASEEKKLATKEYQDKIAASIVRSIKEYCDTGRN